MERERVERAATPEPTPARDEPKRAPATRPRPTRTRPTELELLEAEIAATEARIADLERTLADDWTNMDVLGAHRAARDELTALLTRWEVLFEKAPAS
jgi:hypothetical protein